MAPHDQRPRPFFRRSLPVKALEPLSPALSLAPSRFSSCASLTSMRAQADDSRLPVYTRASARLCAPAECRPVCFGRELLFSRDFARRAPLAPPRRPLRGFDRSYRANAIFTFFFSRLDFSRLISEATRSRGSTFDVRRGAEQLDTDKRSLTGDR